MASSRLLRGFPILISIFVILHKGQSQCSCSKNNMLKNMQGSTLQFTKQNLPKFEIFNDFFKNSQKKLPEVQSKCTSTTLQKPALERQNNNIVQKPLELQIPISSISIGNGNGISFQGPSIKPRPGSNCCQSPGKDLIGELNLLNTANLESSSQNNQQMKAGFVPISFNIPPNVFDMSNQLGALRYDFTPCLGQASDSLNVFSQNHIQNIPTNLEKTVMANPPIFNPAPPKTQSPPLVYLIQAPSIPQYVPPVNCPASTSKSMDIKTIIPLLLELLSDKNCGCSCPNCPNCGYRLKKEHPVIHSGYAKKNFNGKIHDESAPETEDVPENTAKDITVDAEKNTADDEDVDSGEYYDTDAPYLKDDSKEN